MLLELSHLAYPLPPDIQRLFEAGDFARMESIIAQRLADPRTPKTLADRLRFQRNIAAEIPKAYIYTQPALLERLQQEIEDFTEDELEALRDDGTFDWRYVNGEVYYKNNCIDVLFKTRPEYAMRATSESVRRECMERGRDLDQFIAYMKEHGHAHARFVVHEELTPDASAVQPGETIRVHLPLPVVYAQVKDARLLSTSHAPTFIAPENEAQRTAFFQLPYEPGMTLSADFSYEIDAPYVDPKPEMVTAEQPSFDTEEMTPHVVFTPYLRALAKEIVGDETNPLLKARRIYDFITTQAVYRFMPPYLTVTNIPEYFCSGLRGDCGVQAITFVTLCRLVGIPAQWQAGLYTTPNRAGNHDWARFYIAPYGWLFADCSFGGSAYRAGAMERWNFYFGNLEPWRLPLCRDFQQEMNPPKQFVRSDPYDNQNGEIETLTRGLTRHEYSTARKIVSYELLD